MIKKIISTISLIVVFAMPAYADMGRIYVSDEDVTVSEDAQKAIILHNLSEEVLILGIDLKATKKTGIIRFIPFPSEPMVSLAPKGVFEHAAAMIKKYDLKYQELFYSKGGEPEAKTIGVQLLLNKKLGAHDLTIIKVNDVSEFRQWVDDYFRNKKLPVKDSYPDEEAIVNDYVKRGIVYFVLDFVELNTATRFVEPVVYRFPSKKLYYPLKTSNTFGGEGSIELIIIAPATICSPGNGPFDPYSSALYKEENPEAQRPYNQRPYCLNLPVKASTSALVIKEEKDLEKIYPQQGHDFFGNQNAFIQVINYTGKYFFKNDIFADIATGVPAPVGPLEEDTSNPWEKSLSAIEVLPKKCSLKPETGPCKAFFKKYYYDAGSKTCKSFIWGGCGGVVPFDTLEDCNKTCLAAQDGQKKSDITPNLGQMEWQGSTSAQKEQFISVITKKEEWTKLWRRAFNKTAPEIDFTQYVVACIFLGNNADWLYSISFGQPYTSGNVLTIPYTLAEMILELKEPFKAKGQYRMKVFRKIEGKEMQLEESSRYLKSKSHSGLQGVK
ncbi:MAG TPA: DUF2330 domain-containing protein [Smithellaceae bacterium]|nr:DUF2330 domain-containing protein [Smithellaceae bacterium]HRS88358.1 DUF2330 domain-containing protein [Smithellaceae bacterium]HRV25003.1 DUF2330 domain-containing protein [Smithellaceae bacterium]